MRRGRSCAATARSRPIPSASWCWAIFGLANPERIALSDSICTALQLAEHCQDVAEDLARGRIYLPLEDLTRFGCDEADLAAEHAGAPLRAVLAFEVERARRLLVEGTPLIAQMQGRPKLAVAAFVAGGHGALDGDRACALRRARRPAARRTRASGARAGDGAAREQGPPVSRRGCELVSALAVADAYSQLRSDHSQPGSQLLLRDPPASRRSPPRHVRGVRVRAPGR